MKAVCGYCHHEDEVADLATSVCSQCGKSHQESGRQQQATVVLDADQLAATTQGMGSQRRIETDDFGEKKDTVRREQRPSSSRGPLPKSIDGYEVLASLGQGGMGTVYLAYEPLLNRKVALKVLAASASNEKTRAAQAARFLSEAVLTGRLGHAGIVPIYHVGHDKHLGYYYTMRYVKGLSLADVLARLAMHDPRTRREYPVTRLLHIFQRVCEAMAFSHRSGVLHRDLKPANVMIADFGEVFVLDWGLAKDSRKNHDLPDSDDSAAISSHDLRAVECLRKHRNSTRMFLLKDRQAVTGRGQLELLREMEGEGGSDRLHVTRAGQILGTPGYLSPEQANEQTLTPASDVFALGVILYQILTNRLPIEDKDVSKIITNTATGNLVPVTERAEALRTPRALCDIVSKAIAFRAEERHRDAGELAEEIALYLEGRAAWKPIAADSCRSDSVAGIWAPLKGQPHATPEALVLAKGASARCKRISLGDLRCEFKFQGQATMGKWLIGLGISEWLGQDQFEPRFELRVGVEDRPIVELLQDGNRVQRRFDVRLQPAVPYEVAVEMTEGRLRAWVAGSPCIDYRIPFPQTGGSVELHVHKGWMQLQGFKLLSLGAPLRLPFTTLPDRLYRGKRFAEARELYRQLAASHPDREEGLAALYKSGLCATAMGDTQAAFQDFKRLEGTMYDHSCALGLAQIGIRDGKLDMAWNALKTGYRRHRSQELRGELWFGMVGLIEKMGSPEEQLRCYREVLFELQVDSHELGQITYEMLDLLESTKDIPEVRKHAIALLEKHGKRPELVSEVLARLCRVGLDPASLPQARTALGDLDPLKMDATALTRFYLCSAEVHAAQGEWEEANEQLRHAVSAGGLESSDAIWARAWQLLLLYRAGEIKKLMYEVHELLLRYRRSHHSHVSYLRVLEGLAYLAKGDPNGAKTAFQRAASYDTFWGWCAGSFLAEQGPDAVLRKAGRNHAGQIAEAMYLLGEAHIKSGNEQSAPRFFVWCLDPAYERAFFTKLLGPWTDKLQVSFG